MNINIIELIITVVLILIILTFHELAHGWMAFQFGDPTAKYEGRLTLNPISHLDPIGTICLAVTVFMGWPAMGWAKPVPVVRERLDNPAVNLPIVALAGPVSNFLMAFIGALLLMFLGRNFIFIKFIQINIALGLFNLIPIPPLDGFRILMGLLPQNLANNIEEKVSSNPAFQYIGIIIAISIASPIIMTPYIFLCNLLGAI